MTAIKLGSQTKGGALDGLASALELDSEFDLSMLAQESDSLSTADENSFLAQTYLDEYSTAPEKAVVDSIKAKS